MKESFLKRTLQIALSAFRENWLAGVILQVVGISVVLAYYFVPAFQDLLQQIALLKEQGGYLFSAAATALFGGLFPFITQILLEKEKPTSLHFRVGLFIVLFWAYRGAEVDLFYRYQSIWFGDDLLFSTILKKTVVDQFIYSPFWCTWIVTLGLLFKDSGLSIRKLRSGLDRTFLMTTLPTIVISTWMIWIPAVAIIYSLPPLLQIPMMNLVVCFYAILLLYLTRHRKDFQTG